MKLHSASQISLANVRKDVWVKQAQVSGSGKPHTFPLHKDVLLESAAWKLVCLICASLDRITESSRLEGISQISQSNHQSNITIIAPKPYHQAPHLLFGAP